MSYQNNLMVTKVLLRWERVRGLSVNDQVPWDLLPAYNYMQKMKIPDVRGHNIICRSKSVKFKQET